MNDRDFRIDTELPPNGDINVSVHGETFLYRER